MFSTAYDDLKELSNGFPRSPAPPWRRRVGVYQASSGSAAGITRHTLLRLRKGDPAVALGIYARVLQALRLENDLAAIARDDELDRRLAGCRAGIQGRTWTFAGPEPPLTPPSRPRGRQGGGSFPMPCSQHPSLWRASAKGRCRQAEEFPDAGNHGQPLVMLEKRNRTRIPLIYADHGKKQGSFHPRNPRRGFTVSAFLEPAPGPEQGERHGSTDRHGIRPL